MSDTTPSFETRDLYSAAYLQAHGFCLKAIQGTTDPKRKCFLFEDPEHRAREVLAAYWSDSPEKRFADAIKSLRSRLYAGV